MSRTVYSMAILALLSASAANASVLKNVCTSSDYQEIGNALESGTFLKGAESKAALEEVLMQERGPVCNRLVDMEIGMGIPGERLSNFEVLTATRKFDLRITHSVEDGVTRVSLAEESLER